MGNDLSLAHKPRVGIIVEVEGAAAVECTLVRVYAPRTFETLVSRLPIHTVIARGDGYVYFPVDIRRGVEKPRQEAEAGWVAYWPRGDALCLFEKKVSMPTPISLLGEVKGDLSTLASAKRGAKAVISVAAEV